MKSAFLIGRLPLNTSISVLLPNTLDRLGKLAFANANGLQTENVQTVGLTK